MKKEYVLLVKIGENWVVCSTTVWNTYPVMTKRQANKLTIRLSGYNPNDKYKIMKLMEV